MTVFSLHEILVWPGFELSFGEYFCNTLLCYTLLNQKISLISTCDTFRMESTSETESEVKEEEMQRKFEEVTAVKEHAKVSDGEFVFRGPGKLTSEQMGVMVAQLEGIKALGFSDCIQKDGESAVRF